MSTALLEVRDLTVSFDGFKALDGFNLSLQPASVRVLIGPNGAGKSTLCDAIIGRVRATGGRIAFRGRDITRRREHEIVRLGICRKFQTPGVLDGLTVWENLALAARQRRGCWRAIGSGGAGLASAERERAEEVLEHMGLRARRGHLAGALAHGQKQWLEMGMVVASDADLLLLDEPAAGMTQEESAQAAALIRRLSSRHSFLVIDHDMTFVDRLEAPVSVMHMGRLLKEGTLDEIRRDPQVAAVYLGRVKEESVA